MNIYQHGVKVVTEQNVPNLSIIANTDPEFTYSEFSLNIIDTSGNSLSHRVMNITNVDFAHKNVDFLEDDELKYCIVSSLYHLNNLIENYVKLSQLMEGQYPLGTAVHGQKTWTTRSGNTSSYSAYFEIDAIFTDAMRIYEVGLRLLLWKFYGDKNKKQWTSFNADNDRKSVLSRPDNIPEKYLDQLINSWNVFGRHLKQYRNCIIHCATITNPENATTCWLELHDYKWRTTIKLPANPEQKNRVAFDFKTGPDALTYCYTLVCHLVELCDSLFRQQDLENYRSNYTLAR